MRKTTRSLCQIKGLTEITAAWTRKLTLDISGSTFKKSRCTEIKSGPAIMRLHTCTNITVFAYLLTAYHYYFYGCVVKALAYSCIFKKPMICARLIQRFSITVLTPPALHICMFLWSLQTFVLFECKCPAKWTSQESALKCARYEFKWNIFTEVYYVTLARCAAQIHECWTGGLELRTANFNLTLS